MKTITVQDLRRWSEVEAALQVEDEILITRDSKPVAKLVRVPAKKPTRRRWDPKKHTRWLKNVWGKNRFRWSRSTSRLTAMVGKPPDARPRQPSNLVFKFCVQAELEPALNCKHELT